MNGAGLEELRVFIAVVREQGFAAAGRHLNLPPSTVSRKVTQLEEQLRCRLLERTTRRLRLTDAGRAYFQQCASALDTIEDASRGLIHNSSEPRGLLRVSAPINLARNYLAPCIARFMEQWPEVRIDLQLTNDFPSFLEQGIDVAIVGGELPSSSLIGQALGYLDYSLFASESYLARHGQPQHPDELSRHRLITCWPLSEWSLTNQGKTLTVHPKSQFNVNEISTAYKVACEGLGIVNLPSSFIAMGKYGQELVPVLPQWQGVRRTISLLYRNRELQPQRVRLFIDFLHQQMRYHLSRS